MAANIKPKPLTTRDYETLDDLYGYCYARGDDPVRFARPLDIGGSNNSHHSFTLQKLARKFLVQKVQSAGRRGPCRYRPTYLGVATLNQWKEERRGAAHPRRD